jgi:hypothetical protein
MPLGGFQFRNQLVYRMHVAGFQSATESVDKHLFGHAAIEIQSPSGRQDFLQLLHVLERLAGKQLAARFDGLAQLFIAPAAQRIEILESQSKRVHAVMARIAQGFAAVDREHLAERGRLALDCSGSFFEGRQVRRRRRRRRA